MRFRLARGWCTAYLNAPPKGIHEIDHVCGLGSLGAFNRLAFLLLLEQLLERILVLVFKLARFKVPDLFVRTNSAPQAVQRITRTPTSTQSLPSATAQELRSPRGVK
jgi:hypothetical protein